MLEGVELEKAMVESEEGVREEGRTERTKGDTKGEARGRRMDQE